MRILSFFLSQLELKQQTAPYASIVPSKPDQNVQSLYPFSDPYPFGWYLYLCGLYKGVPPPPRDDSKLINFTFQGHSQDTFNLRMKILEMDNIRVQLSSIISGVVFDDFIIELGSLPTRTRCVKTWRQYSVPCTLNGLVSKEEATFV